MDRGSYLAVLGEHLAMAVGGYGRLVVVAGGIGKKALVSASSRNMRRDARPLRRVRRPLHADHVCPLFVSLLLAAGRRPVRLRSRGGHSMAICQDTYAHVIAEFRGVAVSNPADEGRKARASLVVIAPARGRRQPPKSG
jgi:hypothetical protein